MTAIVKQEIAWHEKTSPGELASRIISDTMLIEDGMGFKLGSVVQSVVTFIGCFILAYISGWKLSLLMSVIIPIIFIIVSKYFKTLKRYYIYIYNFYNKNKINNINSSIIIYIYICEF